MRSNVKLNLTVTGVKNTAAGITLFSRKVLVQGETTEPCKDEVVW